MDDDVRNTSFAKQSIASNPCKTGRPFPIDGVYDTAALARGRNAAGPVYKRESKISKFKVC